MNKKFLFQNKEIDYIITGNGPAIVLLHGFLESKSIWNDFIVQLKDTFQMIAIDLPGHGESDSLEKILSMELQAQIVHTILTEEKISKAVVVGHSMGGYAAATFCERYESMAAGLVFFHSHAAPDTEKARENRQRLINIVNENKGGFISQFIPDLFDQKHVNKYLGQIESLKQQALQMTKEAVISALEGMRDRPGNLQFLQSSTIPILFIIGKQDTKMNMSRTFAQAELPAHCEILLLQDVGHMGFIEAPSKTLLALKCFAQRCFDENLAT
jgi:pimeloyl-ACP methyl ester carboxylesterase